MELKVRIWIAQGRIAEAQQAIEAAFPGHARTVARLFRVLTDGEQDELRRLCRKLGTSIAQGSEV